MPGQRNASRLLRRSVALGIQKNVFPGRMVNVLPTDRSTAGSRSLALWCHVALAVIVCLALAMTVHLVWIQASGEVVGAGAFLMVMWLGIPAVPLTITAAVNSIKALDRKLIFITAYLVLVIAAAILAAPYLLVSILAIIYVLLVASELLNWWRHRTRQTAG